MVLTADHIEAELTIQQRALIDHIHDHPGTGKAAAARATIYGQGASAERERMRTIDSLIRRGLVRNNLRDAKARLVPWSLQLTVKGARWWEAMHA